MDRHRDTERAVVKVIIGINVQDKDQWCALAEKIMSFSFLIKPTDALIFPNLFCQGTLHVSGSSSAHHQEFSIVQSALVYVMQI